MRVTCWCACLIWLAGAAGAQTSRRIAVVEETGGAIAGAQVIVRSASSALLQQASTGADGSWALAGLPPGRYWLEISAHGFQVHRSSVDVAAAEAPPLQVVLSLAGLRSEITVTAERGSVADIDRTGPMVSVREGDELRRGPLTTVGDALDGAVGIMVQQSTRGQVSPFLRGLTGYHVLNLVDGVRFNNSTFRSGPNQYLAFVDPSQVQRIEATLGPASTQFGSDALGGAIQLLTPSALFADGLGLRVKGHINAFAGSADRSAGADASAFVSTRRVALSVGGSRRRLGDLRAGGGSDSHHVLRRLFGLSTEQIQTVMGTRQEGTGFTQFGAHSKLAARLTRQQNLTLWYQHSTLSDLRGYKDLWGGLGRLRSDFDPQGLDLFYTRYEKLGAGPLDWLNATFSINKQRDGSIRQGLRSTDSIVQDDVGVVARGYAVQAGAHLGGRQSVVFGAEIYDEGVDARRDETNPGTGFVTQKRALYPNGSRYRTTGVFVQNVVDLIRGSDRGALTANIGGRFTRVEAETSDASNRTALGQSLGVADSAERYQDWTFNGGLTWQPTRALTLKALIGRGFRAPNLNDLGALGLNDLGYEVPASATLEAESYVGASDGEGVASNGRRVERLRAERLLNYEVGAAWRWRRMSARAHVFDAGLKDPIVRRTLLFPIDRAPATVAGLPVTPIPPSAAQRAQQLIGVATSFDSRALKAFVNDGAARYYGVDAIATYRVSTRWFTEGNYSYLAGHDLRPTRPVRRLPPQHGSLSLRYQPGGALSWVAASMAFAGAQQHLSGGDVTDERIGAARRRSDITDFFQGGLIRPFVSPGVDDRYGTSDDVFEPTGETLAQIRDRVLPIGAVVNGVTIVDDAVRVPLATRTPGFVSVNLGAGAVIGTRVSLNLSVTNLLDRNYRIHGSGVDASGIGIYLGARILY